MVDFLRLSFVHKKQLDLCVEFELVILVVYFLEQQIDVPLVSQYLFHFSKLPVVAKRFVLIEILVDLVVEFYLLVERRDFVMELI